MGGLLPSGTGNAGAGAGAGASLADLDKIVEGAPLPPAAADKHNAALTALLGARNAPIEVTIFDGRKLVIAEPKGSANFKATVLVPAHLAMNVAVVSKVQTVLYLQAIDGIPVLTETWDQVSRAIDQLGDEGMIHMQLILEEKYPISASLGELLTARSKIRPL